MRAVLSYAASSCQRWEWDGVSPEHYEHAETFAETLKPGVPAHPVLSPTESPKLVTSPGEISLQLAASQNLVMPAWKMEGWRLRYGFVQQSGDSGIEGGMPII